MHYAYINSSMHCMLYINKGCLYVYNQADSLSQAAAGSNNKPSTSPRFKKTTIYYSVLIFGLDMLKGL